MKIYNSLKRQLEEFVSIKDKQVGMYTCGQTVYDYTHIGHGRKYVNDDVLRRVLIYLGYEVKHVQNVTDVGHLVSDADEGEDKLEKGARKFGQTVWEVAEYFTEDFYQSLDKLNVLRPDVISKATEHIQEQIKMVETLIKKGFAYDTPEAVYFDINKFTDYGKMFGQKLEDKKVGVREEVKVDEYKKHPADFVLWVKRVGPHATHSMHWESPWGDGFPGWHIECSAMSIKYLGEQFDIHTGGIEHIPIHHPNEIAQSEAATGKKPFVKYWMHSNHLMVEGQKMSKSLGNLIRVEDVGEKGLDPMVLRYFYFSAHYRRELNFTWGALEGAARALERLRNAASLFKMNQGRPHLNPLLQGEENSSSSDEEGVRGSLTEWQKRFVDRISDDLDMPGAVAVMWEMVKDNSLKDEEKLDLLLDWDRVLGLSLGEVSAFQRFSVSSEVQELVDKREQLRSEKKWEEADEMRKQIERMGYEVEDTANGATVKPLKR